MAWPSCKDISMQNILPPKVCMILSCIYKNVEEKEPKKYNSFGLVKKRKIISQC
jgi:hypothetical protein